MKNLIRGQDEISVDNVLAKLRKKFENKEIEWSSTQRRWLLPYDNGKSPTPIDDPIQLVMGPDGPVIIDGHHEYYLSLWLGASSISAVVVKDYSNFTPLEFWKTMAAQKLSLLKATPERLARDLPQSRDVTDNPNRYLASLLGLKVGAKIKGSADAIWYKFDQGVPFIEFEIAEILKNSGIEYQANWGNSVPKVIREAARKALFEAQQSSHHGALQSIYIPSSHSEGKNLREDSTALQSLRIRFTTSTMQCQSIFGD